MQDAEERRRFLVEDLREQLKEYLYFYLKVIKESKLAKNRKGKDRFTFETKDGRIKIKVRG